MLRSLLLITAIASACSQQVSIDAPKTKSSNSEADLAPIKIDMNLTPSSEALALSPSIITEALWRVDGCSSNYVSEGSFSQFTIYKGDTGCRASLKRLKVDGRAYLAPASFQSATGSVNLFTEEFGTATLIVRVDEQLSSPITAASQIAFSFQRSRSGSNFNFQIPTVNLSVDRLAIREGDVPATVTVSRDYDDKPLKVFLSYAGTGMARIPTKPAFVDMAIGQKQKTFTLAAPFNNVAEEDEELELILEDGAYLFGIANELLFSVEDPAPTISLATSYVGSGPISLNPIISDDAEDTSPMQTSGLGTLTFYYEGTALMVTASSEGHYTATIKVSALNGKSSSASTSLLFDFNAPVIGTIALANGAADELINSADATAALPLVSPVNATDLTSSTISYRVESAQNACNASSAYSAAIPLSNNSNLSAAGNYKVCVKAVDPYGHIALAESRAFGYMVSFSSAVLGNLPSSIATSTAISVSGVGVASYRYVFGLATINCSTATYGPETAVAQTININLAAYDNASVKICVIAKNNSGNWQTAAAATFYTWTVDISAPAPPTGFSVSKRSERIAISFTANTLDTAGYLVIRSAGALQGFTAEKGQDYAVGDTVGNGTVFYKGLENKIFDSKIGDTAPYTYTLLAFDAVRNYSARQAASAAADARLPFNNAHGFDRGLRGVTASLYTPGKTYAWGDFTLFENLLVSRIARFNEDGTIDTSFVPPVINGSIYTFVEDSAGRVYIGGTFTTVGGISCLRLARLLESGALDTSFVTTQGPNSTVNAIDIDEDLGRVYVAGNYTKIGTKTTNRIVALDMNGAVDTSFAIGSGLSAVVYALRVDRQLGGIYVGGNFTKYNGVNQTSNTSKILKLRENGTLDTSFATLAGFGTSSGINVYTIEIDSLGKVYVGGNFTTYKGSSNYRYLLRLSSSGAVDANFAVSPRFDNAVRTLVIDEAYSALYVGGDFTLYGTQAVARLAKLNLDVTGSPDLSFNNQVQEGPASSVLGLALSESGVYVAGGFTGFRTENVPYIAHVAKTNAALLDTMPRGTMFNGQTSVAVRGSNEMEIYVGGNFTGYQNINATRLARVDGLGSPDPTYLPTPNGAVSALLYEASGDKLIAAGAFTTVNGATCKRIVRLTSSGAIDSSFSAATAFDAEVLALGAGDSGKVWVGGKFTVWNNTARKYIALLKTDGTLLTTFDPGSGFNNFVYAVLPTADGGAIVGGAFTSYNGTAVNRLVKLKATGAIDTTFSVGTGMNSTVRTLTLKDGLIYVGGDFTNYKGVTTNRIARLTATGALDTTFALGTGFNGSVYDIAYDSATDRLAITGAFTTYSGQSRNRIALVSTSGAVDPIFLPQTGLNTTGLKVLPTYSGIIVLGNFLSYRGYINGSIVRLGFYGAMQ